MLTLSRSPETSPRVIYPAALNCREHVTGSCPKDAASCPFSHDPATVDPCRQLVLNGNCRSRACPYSHAQLEPDVVEVLSGYFDTRILAAGRKEHA